MLRIVYVYLISGQPKVEAGHTKFQRTGFIIELGPVLLIQYLDVQNLQDEIFTGSQQIPCEKFVSSRQNYPCEDKQVPQSIVGKIYEEAKEGK